MSTVDRAQVAQAIQHAHAAFAGWRALTAKARGEYLHDRGAQKFFGTRAVLTDPTTFVPSAPDKVLELTGTVQYDLWKNVMTRLEVRWDHSLTGGGIWGGSKSRRDGTLLLWQPQ